MDIDDVMEYDPELAEAIGENTRRFTLLFGEVIQEMLPNYKEHDVEARDALDVYIAHRLLVEGQNSDGRTIAQKYPPELMRRL